MEFFPQVILTMCVRAGIWLPTNFDSISLSEKEREKVRRAGQNPYRREGELPGDEAIDMNGNMP